MSAKNIEPAKAAYTLPAPTWRATSVSSDGFNGFDLIQNVGEVSVFLTFDVNAKPITPLPRPNIVQDLSLRGIRVGAGIVLPSKSEEEQKRKISTCLKFPQRLYKGMGFLLA